MKLVTGDTRRDYELTYLVDASLTETELVAARETVTKLVEKFGGEITDTQDWGKKNLSYTIQYEGKSFDKAVYTHLVISFETDKVQDFEKELYLEDSVIRHLLVVAEELAENAPLPQSDDSQDEEEAESSK